MEALGFSRQGWVKGATILLAWAAFGCHHIELDPPAVQVTEGSDQLGNIDMKKIVVIRKGGFGKEMPEYLSDTFSADSGYEFERIEDLFPNDELIVKPDEVFVVANGDPAVKSCARLHSSRRGRCRRRM